MPLAEEFQVQGNYLFRYRSFFPILILIVGLGLHIHFRYLEKGLGLEEYYYAICFAVSMVGQLIRILVVGYAPQKTSGRNTKKQVAEQVNTKGLYSIVRHPLYLGNFLMWLGIGMLTENIWFMLIFTLSYWVYYERIMFAEEAFLRGKFGDQYLAWAGSVPAFIPRLNGWIWPDTYFSFKNVLRREYTSFFNLIIVFFIFHYSQSVIRYNGFANFGFTEVVWFGILAFAILFYLTVRFLHKKTRLLNVEGR